MTVEKTFGFGNSSPYRSATFNKNNELIFGKNGLLSAKSIVNDGPNVLLEDIVFVQQGVIVRKIGTVSITFPTGLPSPFYLTATIPDTNPTDNVSWGFVRRPQDIGENTVLLAEWDGQEWRPMSKMTLKAILEDRLKAAIAYNNIGFNQGFRFIPDPTFSNYTLTEGLLTDQAGQLTEKVNDSNFVAIGDDPDWNRIDVLAYRRLKDDPNRIGTFILRPGNTYNTSNITSLYSTTVGAGTEVKSNPKVLNLSDNTFVLLYIEDYGANGKIVATKYGEDRQTELVAPTTILTGVQEFDAIVDKDDNIVIVLAQTGEIYRMKLNSSLGIVLGAAPVENLTNPCSKPTIKTDFIGNYYIMFLYQSAPAIFQPYFVKLNNGGAVSVSSKLLVNLSKRYISVDFDVDRDFVIHAVYVNDTDDKVEYHKLDEIGDQIEPRVLISDEVDHNGTILTSSSFRNAKMHFCENHEMYVTWEQSKSISQWGLVFYSPSYKRRFGSKAIMKDITSPTENITKHAISLDWNNHAFILVGIGGDVFFYKYFLPELGTRLPAAHVVSTAVSDHFDLVYDKKGSLIVSYAGTSSGTTINGTPVTTGLFGSATYGPENVFVNSDEIAFPLSDLNLLPEVPTFGDSIIVSLSTQGNNGTYTAISQRDAQINGSTHRIYRFSGSSFTAESASGVEVQFERLNGNDLHFLKQTSAIEYDFSEVSAEIVNTDIIAVMINTADNSFLAWYDQVQVSGDDTTLRGETFLTSSGEIEWDKDTNGGTLSWSQPLAVVDPYRNEFIIEAGSQNFFNENDVLYIIYPKTEFFIEDGETAGPNIASITDISQFYIGQEVFIGDSDSSGLVTTVTNLAAGEVTVAATITQFSKIRGAYIIPRTVQLLKERQNNGALKPNSLGDVNTRIFTIATRKNNLVTFRSGALTLEHGERGNIGDGAPESVLEYIGASDEADSTPDYTNALGTPIPNVVLVDGENLTKAIKRLETKSDTATVNYVDSTQTSLPTGTDFVADGITMSDGETVLFTNSAIEGIYQISGAGVAISWTQLNLFSGSVTPTNGSLVKVIDGTTPYFQTVWERRLDIWKPTDISDATQDPTGFKFEDLANSEILFDDLTRTFTIQPTGDHYDFFIKGRIFRKTQAESLVIPDTTGLHFFYYETDGTLAQSPIFDISIITEKAYVAAVYWNAETQANYLIAEERHGISMDYATHSYLHQTRGAVLSRGFNLGFFNLTGDGSADEHAKFSIDGGRLHDEDLTHTIVHSATPTNRFEQILEPYAQCPIYYRFGANGAYRADNATDFAVKFGVARPVINKYNGTTLQWETPDVTTDGLFFHMWAFATNNIDEPVILVVGQDEYPDLETAQTSGSYTDLNLGDFPFAEFKALHKFVFEADSNFGNSVKAALRYTEDVRFGQDSGFPTTSVSDHGQLTGLQDPDHPARAVTTDLVEKDGGLSEQDLDMEDVANMLNRFFGQLRLKEHPTNKKRVVITGAERLLNDGTIFGQTINGYMMQFNGAEIDFSTGSIYAADGLTPLGIDFTPEPTGLTDYRWYSVAIVLKEEAPDLSGIAQVRVIPALNVGSSPSAAEKALWSTGTPIGQVVTQGSTTSLVDITQDQIFWLGLGSGGGTGGSGGGSGVGASYKARAYGYTDGSLEEFNMQPPYYNSGTDHTEIVLDFQIYNGEVVRVHVGQENFTQYISDTVTPEKYWRMLSPQVMEIKGNITSIAPAEPISIEVLEGVEVAPQPPTYLAGLEKTFEAYGYTDGVGGSSGIASISTVGGKTQIVLENGLKPEEIINLFIDNKYYPPCLNGIVESNCYRVVDFQTLELDSDYSGVHSSIYIATYEGKSHVDAMGNVCITLRPTIAGIILQSPDENRWRIYATNDGEAVTETVFEGTPDPVHVYDEDGIIAQLLVDNDGNLYTEKPPVTPGLVFEELYLASENGLAWKLHILGSADPETEGVIQLRDSVGNKWCLLNQIGEVIYQVSQTAQGAIIDTQYIEENNLSAPQETNGAITWALVQRSAGPAFALWNTYTNEWELTGGRSTGFVGDVEISFLTETQFQASRDTSWILADGREVLGSKWHTLYGNVTVPDMRGVFIRGKNNGREDNFKNFEGELPLGGLQLRDWKGMWWNNTGRATGSYTHGPQWMGKNMDDNGDSNFVGNIFVGYWAGPAAAMGIVWQDDNNAEVRPTNITVNYFIKIND